MNVDVVKANGYDFVKAELNVGEEIYSQPGALMSFKGNVRMETKSFGGIFGGLKRSFLGGESFFINKYVAESTAELTFSPSLPGEVKKVKLEGGNILVRDGAYLLHAGNINVDTKFFGLKGLFSSGGFFWLDISGYGDVFLNVYGSVLEVELSNDVLVVDNYNLLAFDNTLEVSLKRIGGLKSFLFGGEGLMYELRGTGRVYIQTRNLSPLIAEVLKHISK